MIRWLKIGFFLSGSLLALVVTLCVSAYWYQSHSAVLAASEKVKEWKRTNWDLAHNFDLLSKAIAAAEDPLFLSQPKLDCGLVGVIRQVASGAEVSIRCSPIITHAARLASSETSMRSLVRHFRGVAVQNEFSKNPTEALDIILNRAHLGINNEKTPIEGFRQASLFYFGKPIDQLKVSQAAMLAGLARSPSYFSPKKNIARAKARRDLVIDRMLGAGFISEVIANSAKKDPLK